MSVTRYQRAIRNMGLMAGGGSRLVRPPAVLPEPDIRPEPEQICTVIHASLDYDGGDVTVIDSVDPNPWGLTAGLDTDELVGFPAGWYMVTLSTDYGGFINDRSIVGTDGKFWPGDNTSTVYIGDPAHRVEFAFFSSDDLGDTGAGPSEATFELCPITPTQGSYSIDSTSQTFDGGVGITDLTLNAGSESSSDTSVIHCTGGTDIQVLQDIHMHQGATVTATWSPHPSPGGHSLILRVFDPTDTLLSQFTQSASSSAGTATLTTTQQVNIPAGSHIELRITNSSGVDTSGVASLAFDWTLD